MTHDGFAPESPMLEAVSGRSGRTGGWPELLANLKTLLETDNTMAATPPTASAGQGA